MSDRLYELLPSIYRIRDEENGEQLRALMSVMEDEFNRLEGDVAGLYQDWFIETCSEWIVPYIADLLGLEGVRPSPDGSYSQRAFVANTTAYRRRKGTVPVLEHIGRDLTNYPSKATEFFQLLAVTEQLNHVRRQPGGTALVGDSEKARRAGSAFDANPHTADVRLIASGRGAHNIMNVGVHLWRVQSFWMERVDAHVVAPGCFTFDPLGRAMALYNRPHSTLDLGDLTEEVDVPEPLHRRPLEDELEQLRDPQAPDTDGVYFGLQPVVEVFVDGKQIPQEQIFAANLSLWRQPPAPSGPFPHFAFDPKLGRLTTHPGIVGRVQVSYCYGFLGDVGGGPYDRRRYETSVQPDLVLKISETGFGSIGAALLALPDQIQMVKAELSAKGKTDSFVAVLEIADNRTYTEDLVLSGKDVDIRLVSSNGCRPTVIGNIKVADKECPKSVTIEGLLVQGSLSVGKNLAGLTLVDTTLVPVKAKDSLTVDAANVVLEGVFARCILGSVSAPEEVTDLCFSDCILDGFGGVVMADGPKSSFARCTVFGSVKVREVEYVSESIFLRPLMCDRTQVGCVRFSYMPLESKTPSRYRCQPDMERDGLYAQAKAKGHDPLSPAEALELQQQAWIATRPRFTSETYGDAAYAQLGRGCPQQVSTGAEDEGEMGVWHMLHEGRRLANFSAGIQEYVRFGLKFGVLMRS